MLWAFKSKCTKAFINDNGCYLRTSLVDMNVSSKAHTWVHLGQSWKSTAWRLPWSTNWVPGQPRLVVARSLLTKTTVFVGFCQLDTNLDITGRGESWEHGFVRLACKQVWGLLSWLIRANPTECGWCHPWAGSPGLYKKEGWASQQAAFFHRLQLYAEISPFLHKSCFWSCYFITAKETLKTIIVSKSLLHVSSRYATLNILF